MENRSAAFTVPFPEARKSRAVAVATFVLFVVFWVTWGFGLYGPPEMADLPLHTLGLIPFALFVGCLVYQWRLQKKLVPLINERFATAFFAHTSERYPADVNILKVQRSVAVQRPDGSVSVWGIERKKDAIRAFPL